MEQQISDFEPEIRELAAYCIRNEGKHIRPLLVFYSAWNNEAPSDDVIRAGAVVELIHLATLVHDDILDEAEVRHRSVSAANKYGSSVAVLLGDSLFAQALNLASQFPTTEVCLEVSAATRRVCAGEIKQTFSAGDDRFSLDDYYRVIELKTAELFRVSCKLGARLAGYDDAFVNAAAEFGYRLGNAYQIFDDVADFYGTEAGIGKTLGTDLAKGKYTLPILTLLNRLPEKDQVDFIQLMRKGSADISPIVALMDEYDIYNEVQKSFRKEIEIGEKALANAGSQPPQPFLVEIGRAVRQQMSRLV